MVAPHWHVSEQHSVKEYIIFECSENVFKLKRFSRINFSKSWLRQIKLMQKQTMHKTCVCLYIRRMSWVAFHKWLFMTLFLCFLGTFSRRCCCANRNTQVLSHLNTIQICFSCLSSIYYCRLNNRYICFFYLHNCFFRLLRFNITAHLYLYLSVFTHWWPFYCHFLASVSVNLYLWYWAVHIKYCKHDQEEKCAVRCVH